MQRRKLLLILRRSPFQGVLFAEALDALLVAAAFEQHCSVLLMDDAVFALLPAQDAALLGMRQANRMLLALPDYEINQLAVCAASAAARGIDPQAAGFPVRVLSTAEQAALIRDHDVIWND
jgi:tRNA 2-thiouridine synthesizing protein C